MNPLGMRNNAITIAVGFVIALLPIAQTKADSRTVSEKTLHIYLLIGQSNMAGRAQIDDEHAGTIEGCFLLGPQGEWEPASNPLNRHSTIRKGIDMQRLNPGYGFAKAMRKANAETRLG